LQQTSKIKGFDGARFIKTAEQQCLPLADCMLSSFRYNNFWCF